VNVVCRSGLETGRARGNEKVWRELAETGLKSTGRVLERTTRFLSENLTESPNFTQRIAPKHVT
jgi:hypothetical protein